MKNIRQRFEKCWNIASHHYYSLYTVIFLVSILFVFGSFFVEGKSFIWQPDGWQQHFRALLYYAEWMRGILKDLVFNHEVHIPTYSFNIGYGSDILTTLHYYVIGDPIALLAVFVPTRYMAYFYGMAVILRFYLAGLTFGIFCFYVKRKYSREYGKMAILAGSFVYMFCGFALYAGVRHPYFLNPMIFFPLVLLGIEKILNKENPSVFILSVFVSAISNFYFFYMIAVQTFLYVLLRIFTRYSWNQRKEIIYTVGKIAGFAILGTCMSAVVLLPQLCSFLSSLRLGTNSISTLLYPPSYYASYFGAFISLIDRGSWRIMGYAAIAIISLILLFMHKGHKDVKVAFIVLTTMTLIPAIGKVMNGFSYASNRWIWGYGFLIAYIVVLKWQSLLSITRKEKRVLLIGLTTYFLVCVVFKPSCTTPSMFAISMAFFVLVVAILARELYGERLCQILLILCVLVNVAGNAFFKYSPEHWGYVKEFVPYSGLNNRLINTEAGAIESDSSGLKEFFRYTGTQITINGTLYSGLHSTQYRWSLENGNISTFRYEMGLADTHVMHTSKNLDSSTILSALANVMYYVQPKGVPFGYNRVNSNGKSNYKIWKNNYPLPFGYTYSNYIPEDVYKVLGPLEKQEALMQGCVVGKDDIHGKEAKVSFSGQQIDYKIKPDPNIVVENNVITVKKRKATLTLEFNGISKAETLLYITGFNFIGNPPLGMSPNLEGKWLSTYKENKYAFYQKYFRGPSLIFLPLSARDNGGSFVYKTLPYNNPLFTWYSNRENFLVNFGYGQESKVAITIEFPAVGRYVFDSLQVLCLPMDNYLRQVEALAEDVMQEVDFHEDEVYHSTDTLTGKINLKKAKYLLMTIPYSTGWVAYVDGRKQGILKANTMYTALYLDAGNHEIELKYSTPGLKHGLLVSGLSFALVAVIWYLQRKKQKKVKGNRKLPMMVQL